MLILRKKLSDIAKPKKGLKHFLHLTMPAYDKPRSKETIHSSDLTKGGYCPRREALEYLFPKKSGSFLSTALQYTFKMGRMLESMLSNDLAGGIAVGDWECLVCALKYQSCLRPGHCECGSTKFEYRSIRFTSQKTGVSAEVDLLLALPGHPKLQIFEVKSIDKDEFKAMKAPYQEHRLRTNLYLRIVDESDNPLKERIDTDHGWVFYLGKMYGIKDDEVAANPLLKDAPFSPFKEFRIERDDSQTDGLVKLAKEMSEFLDQGIMPNRICPSVLDPMAKKCSMMKKCFGEDYCPGFKVELKELGEFESD